MKVTVSIGWILVSQCGASCSVLGDYVKFTLDEVTQEKGFLLVSLFSSDPSFG
jgi:hypothetical protein